MTRRKVRIVLAASAAIVIAASIVGAVIWRELAERRRLPFPLIGEPVVGRLIYSPAGDLPEPPLTAPRLHDWRVVGALVAVAPDVAAELRDILGTPSSYTINNSQCFEPGMAVSFGDGPHRVDVLICLLCNRAVFYSGDSQVGRCISDEGNKRLSAIYLRIFGSSAARQLTRIE